jgi:hypothetical protein
MFKDGRVTDGKLMDGVELFFDVAPCRPCLGRRVLGWEAGDAGWLSDGVGSLERFKEGL